MDRAASGLLRAIAVSDRLLLQRVAGEGDPAGLGARLAATLTDLGKTPGYLYLCLGLATRDGRLALETLAVLAASEALNAGLKHAVRRPRPRALGSAAHAIEGRFSFPSCHAQNVAAVWGFLAVRSGSWLVSLAAVLVALAIGWARLRLRQHYPSDVVVGWCVGTILAASLTALIGLMT